MNNLTNKQNRAVLREYREAIEDQDWRLVARILKANPDLFPKHKAR